MALIENYSGLFPEAGCDEAGRGCLAGPVVAAAVIFPSNYANSKINDSKKLTEKNRLELKEIIINEAIDFGVGIVEPKEIDKINILNASILAMHLALNQLKTIPEHIIVDGNRFKAWKNVPYSTLVKGDASFLAIAAASILAKTYRDAIMVDYDKEFPAYKWKQNKGYPTIDHIKGIDCYGLSPIHRLSFHLKRQLKIDF